MKKIILVVGGVIVIALAGRAIWAWQQIKKDETKMATMVDTTKNDSVQTNAATKSTPPTTVITAASIPRVKPSTELTAETYVIKIKLDNGEVASRKVTLAEYEKYQSALSRFPIDEKSKLETSTAFPSEGSELIKNAFGKEIQTYKSTNVITFSQISDTYIVNVLTGDKKEVVDFAPFPLSLAIDLTDDALKIDPSKLSIYYWGGTSVCSEKNCGYYVATQTYLDTKNKQAIAAITRPGQYLLGVSR